MYHTMLDLLFLAVVLFTWLASPSVKLELNKIWLEFGMKMAFACPISATVNTSFFPSHSAIQQKPTFGSLCLSFFPIQILSKEKSISSASQELIAFKGK